MVDVIEKAHEVYELTNSDLICLFCTAFASGILISDGFYVLIKWLLKHFKLSS